MPVNAWIAASDTEKINQALTRLRERGVPNSCPRCGHYSWIAELVAFHASPMPPSVRPSINIANVGSYIPALALTCRNCGSIFQHNLITLGLMENTTP